MRSLAREDVLLGLSGQSFSLLSHLLIVISSSRLAALACYSCSKVITIYLSI